MTQALNIRELRVRAVRIPMAEPHRTASGVITESPLVLTDVVMPRMGGVRLAEQIAAQRPSLRVVFMSGYAENFEAQLGPGARPVFLAKPFSSSELVAFVRSQITSPAPLSR